jgi:hypothetical protein
VFAQAPGESKRVLPCRGPVFDGDHIFTEGDSAVGIDAGSFYVRLGESSEVELGALASGAPRVDLVAGHVRVMDSAEPAVAAAELTTPGLSVARTGPDVDALVFGEKATAVSMVCAYGPGVDVARRSKPEEFRAAAPGSCVVGKPREPLYVAPATHPMLAVLMQDACDELALQPVAGQFTPTSVALGPAVGDPGVVAPQPQLLAIGGINQPCSPACPQPPVVPPSQPTQFPFVPPVLPVP